MRYRLGGSSKRRLANVAGQMGRSECYPRWGDREALAALAVDELGVGQARRRIRLVARGLTWVMLMGRVGILREIVAPGGAPPWVGSGALRLLLLRMRALTRGETTQVVGSWVGVDRRRRRRWRRCSGMATVLLAPVAAEAGAICRESD
jgi:hypothetical protein